MKKEKIKTILITSAITFFCTILLIAIVINVKNNSEVSSLKNTNEVKNKQFAVMLQNESGGYAESESSSWPTTGYELNTSLTNCTDETGTKLENVLRYENGNIAVKSNKKLYCYLYFDSLSGLCTSGSKLGSCLIGKNNKISSLNDNIEGGLYRYQGTNEVVNNNYICFGTSNKEECVNDTDKYMYRIIGVNESGQLKLIKKEALNETMKWYSSNANYAWINSPIYTNINGSSFLNNTSYIPSGWKNKIVDYEWKYGDNPTNNVTALELYNIEDNWTTKTTAKIGLIYGHDYAYGLSGGNNCSPSGNYSSCKNSWMFITNNDELDESTEWTMSRYGYVQNNSFYGSWLIDQAGYFHYQAVQYPYAVRPVFYLNADEVFVSGMGTEDDPIMLEKPTAAEILLSNPTTGLNTTIEGGLYRYQGTTADNYICFGYSNSETDCDFSNTTNSDRYAYRIIGISPNGQLKLIKKGTLETTYKWHNVSSNIVWKDSDLFKGLNGISGGTYNNLFIGNSKYISSVWLNKIADTEWKYGDTTNINVTALNLYQVESAWTNTITAKIGLMYAHDYAYGLSGGNNCHGSGNGVYATCKTSWIHMSNNGISGHEWTMSRKGYDSGYATYCAWPIYYDGAINTYLISYDYDLRPVFYLNKDVYITNPEATGTSADPFIIN